MRNTISIIEGPIGKFQLECHIPNRYFQDEIHDSDKPDSILVQSFGGVCYNEFKSTICSFINKHYDPDKPFGLRDLVNIMDREGLEVYHRLSNNFDQNTISMSEHYTNNLGRD